MGAALISKRLVIDVVVEDTGVNSEVDMLKVAMDALAETLAEEPESYPAMDGTVEDHRGELYDQILEAGRGQRSAETLMKWDYRYGPPPDMCERRNCEHEFEDGTGDDDEGHWVCGRSDCGTHLSYDEIRALSDEDMAEFLRKIRNA